MTHNRPATDTSLPSISTSPPTVWWRGRLLRGGLTIAVLGFGCGLLAIRWDTYGEVFSDANPAWLVVATSLLIVGNLFSTALSAELLEARGTPARRLPLARVVLVSNVAKYIPGFVAQMATYFEMARRIGLSRRSVLLMWVETLWLTVAVSSAVGAGALLMVDSPAPTWVGVLLLAGSLLLLVPRVRDGILGVTRIAPQSLGQLGTLHLRPLLLAIGGVLLLGAHGVALARGLGVSDLSLAEATAAFAGGWVVGLLAFVFPGGIGPRELVASTLLAEFTSPATALVLVVLSRITTVLADTLAGAAALLLIKDRPGHWGALATVSSSRRSQSVRRPT